MPGLYEIKVSIARRDVVYSVVSCLSELKLVQGGQLDAFNSSRSTDVESSSVQDYATCTGAHLEAVGAKILVTEVATERAVHRMFPRVGLASQASPVVIGGSYIFPGSMYTCHFDGSAMHHDGERVYNYTTRAVVVSRDKLSASVLTGHPWRLSTRQSQSDLPWGNMAAGNFYLMPVLKL